MTDDALNVRLSLPVELSAPTVVSVPYKPPSVSGLRDAGFPELADWLGCPTGHRFQMPHPGESDLCVLRLCGLEVTEDADGQSVHVAHPGEVRP